jgi:hypothetical protein
MGIGVWYKSILVIAQSAFQVACAASVIRIIGTTENIYELGHSIIIIAVDVRPFVCTS